MAEAGRCASCAHFCNDPARVEALVPGLAVLSSGYASVRADDGVCAWHGVLLTASSTCGEYVVRGKECR